jgi:hypothetical protein
VLDKPLYIRIANAIEGGSLLLAAPDRGRGAEPLHA